MTSLTSIKKKPGKIDQPDHPDQLDLSDIHGLHMFHFLQNQLNVEPSSTKYSTSDFSHPKWFNLEIFVLKHLSCGNFCALKTNFGHLVSLLKVSG